MPQLSQSAAKTKNKLREEKTMTKMGRRGFVKGATLGALAFTVGGVEAVMAPGEARARNVPFRLLDAHQGETLEALGETLVP
jgi:secreted PhoX family phosphatase